MEIPSIVKRDHTNGRTEKRKTYSETEKNRKKKKKLTSILTNEALNSANK